tara:strand:- start:2097 stop:3344 length:1248 start_codon:yes stop_codon:yes gene_type:complete
MSAKVSIYFDRRRSKKDNTFPVKLRVWDTNLKESKLYNLNMDLTQKQYKGAWESSKPRSEFKEIRKKLFHYENKAIELIDAMRKFSYDEFERKFFRKKGDGTNIKWQYERYINELNKMTSLNTASTYKYSLKSISVYLKSKKKSLDNLSFFDIDKKWLQDYEDYMLDSCKSRNTISIYIRCLKSIFNNAIQENEINRDVYPFGKRRYVIPNEIGFKKALTMEQLKKLYNSKPTNQYQSKAKDFWLLSYFCNGMNLKDILFLKNNNIDEDLILFKREKTIKTSKSNLKTIKVKLLPEALKIIKKYSNKSSDSEEYIFGVIKEGYTPEQKTRAINNFVRMVNQHLQKLAIKLEIPKDISTNWARHTFATTLKNKKYPLKFISEFMGHSSIKTTEIYFASIDDEMREDMSESLMDFNN